MPISYRPIPASAVPAGLRWDVPPRHQGQIVEVAYADAGRGRYAASEGDEYRQTTDRSTGEVAYAQRAAEAREAARY